MHGCGLWHWGSRLLCHPRAKELVVLAAEPFTGTNPQRGWTALAGTRPWHPHTVSVPYLGGLGCKGRPVHDCCCGSEHHWHAHTLSVLVGGGSGVHRQD